LADAREGVWAALRIDAPAPDDELDGRVTALLTDFNPIAIEDLAELPLPPGGLWDPTFPPIPEPPPTPLRWRAFFHTTNDRDAAHVALAAAFPTLTLADVDIPDEDWAARSQRSLTSVEAGRFIVAPPWDVPASSGESLIVVIEPSMGFGTGHHATTRLCLRALSAMELKGRSVLDLGTGSGVLAIAAAMAGASAVVGIDVDRDAIDNARHNASLNRVFVPPRFEVADFREHTLRSADIVVANLTGGMLRSSADGILALVAQGGTLLVSGFDESERAAVHEALGDWKHESSATEDNWVALRLSDGESHRA
jgi:ribosomal protein L11 methyltransferase